MIFELDTQIEQLDVIQRNTYVVLADDPFGTIFGLVGFLISSSSSSSSFWLSGGASESSPAAFRRRKTAFSNSDIIFGFGGCTGSASFDDTEALSSSSSVSARCLLMIGVDFVGRPNVLLSPSSSESVKESH